MISTPEAGTFAAKVKQAEEALGEARAQFLGFDMSMDSTQHSEALTELRHARTAAIEFVRHLTDLNDDLANLLEASAPLGVWVWVCHDPEASPVQGDSADDYAGAYVRHFATDGDARRWLASSTRDLLRVGDEPAPLFIVNHGEVVAVWGVDE